MNMWAMMFRFISVVNIDDYSLKNRNYWHTLILNFPSFNFKTLTMLSFHHKTAEALEQLPDLQDDPGKWYKYLK
jgi:hypothetical protein